MFDEAPPCLIQQMKNLAQEYQGDKVADVLMEASRRIKAAEDMLLSFTPSGSEYFLRDGDGFKVDIEACRRVIRERYDHLHKARCELAQLSKGATPATREE